MDILQPRRLLEENNLLVPQWDMSLTSYFRDGIQYMIMTSTTKINAVD